MEKLRNQPHHLPTIICDNWFPIIIVYSTYYNSNVWYELKQIHHNYQLHWSKLHHVSYNVVPYKILLDFNPSIFFADINQFNSILNKIFKIINIIPFTLILKCVMLSHLFSCQSAFATPLIQGNF